MGYSLKRTRSIYYAMNEKVKNGNDYIANFPLILYLSPKFIKEHSLEEVLTAVRNLEERRDTRLVPIIARNRYGDEYDVTAPLRVKQHFDNL